MTEGVGHTDESRSPRSAFEQAAGGFVELVNRLSDADWRAPALGEWDVRALVGHTSRAMSTIETYLATGGGEPQLHDPVDYFLAVLADSSDREGRARQDAAVAARGRQAGADLGESPADEVAALAGRITALLRVTADDAPVATPAGTMRLADYLPTRTFELTVHSLDLARAIGVPPPALLAPAITATWQLAARIASRRANAGDLLLNLLGREFPGRHPSAL